MTPTCINLKERFGRRYRVEYEESYFAEHGPGARVEDTVLMVIPCKWGQIYPAGGMRLAASVDGHPLVAGRLRRQKCCEVLQDGDHGELTATFDVADFPKIARVMRPRTRRRLSESARRKLVEAGAKTRFQHGTQVQRRRRTDAPEPQGDPEAIGEQMSLFEPYAAR